MIFSIHVGGRKERNAFEIIGISDPRVKKGMLGNFPGNET
jgi:hypothetical protein